MTDRLSSPGGRHRLARACAVLVLPLAVGLVGLVGCGPAAGPGSGTASAADRGPSPTTEPSDSGPSLTTNAQDGLAASAVLRVTATRGRLSEVTVSSAYGELAGQLNGSGTEWTSSQERAPKVTYQVRATATNDAGGTTTLDRSFTTGASPRTLTADVTPWGDQQVGVGQPIVVKLSSSVTGTKARAEVEKGLVVRADREIGPASWSWLSGTELHYRPQSFWPANTKVQVDVKFAGVHAGRGLWGVKDRTVSFRIGRAFVMRINDATHRMTVTVDGKVVRTIPVSMGRTGYETRSGIKTIMSHEKTVRMTSASYGGKDYYDEIVHYGQRLTWSGEFIHSAPWSVASQGVRNVSHGCVNISPTDAVWLFGQTLIGDPVITTGTKRQMEPGNGTGGDWNVAWATWTGNSALSGPPQN